MQWADERILQAAAKLPNEQTLAQRGSSFGGILGTLQHIYGSQRVWLSRLAGDPNARLSATDAPPDTVFLQAVWPQLHSEWNAWAESVTDWNFVHAVRNQKGEESRLARWQIVLHVINHASYHRGQIVTMLRQAGATDLQSTDLVAFYRELAARSAA